jgi:hypothetical protein
MTFSVLEADEVSLRQPHQYSLWKPWCLFSEEAATYTGAEDVPASIYTACGLMR